MPIDMPELDLTNLGIDPNLQEQDIFVVISHDCDICHDSAVDEPYIEVIPSRLVNVGQPDGNRLDGKSPRHLQLRIADRSSRIFDLNITERRLIPRRVFQLTDGTFGGIDKCDLPVLRRWLRRRYDRTVLPDAFVSRARPASNALTNKLKRGGELVSSVWLRVDSQEELSGDGIYRVILFLVMQEDDFANSAHLEQVLAVKTAVTVAFARCEGIELLDVEIRSEADITMADIRELTRWDYADHLSYRGAADPVDLTPAD